GDGDHGALARHDVEERAGEVRPAPLAIGDGRVEREDGGPQRARELVAAVDGDLDAALDDAPALAADLLALLVLQAIEEGVEGRVAVVAPVELQRRAAVEA